VKNIVHPIVEARVSHLFYRFRFLFVYIIFGFGSLLLEFMLRSYLAGIGVNIYWATILSIFCGILFAFWANVRFNFKVPKSRRNRALKYFAIISCGSITLQWFLREFFPESFTYESARLIISGILFSFVYVLHRNISFKDYKKVGVAIYANGVEDVEGIYGKIGYLPDFIHVDIIDKTVNKDADVVTTYRMETIRAYWPGAQIQTHIMSRQPSQWIDQVLQHSDVVFVHAESDDNIEKMLDKIQNEGRKAGVALSLQTKPSDALPLLKKADAVLILTIPILGFSGQKFDMDGLEQIKEINALPFRNKIMLCVDGGVNDTTAGLIEAENIVSGSFVLDNPNPKKQIVRLRTSVFNKVS